jgi:hypothetical protein
MLRQQPRDLPTVDNSPSVEPLREERAGVLSGFVFRPRQESLTVLRALFLVLVDAGSKEARQLKPNLVPLSPQSEAGRFDFARYSETNSLILALGRLHGTSVQRLTQRVVRIDLLVLGLRWPLASLSLKNRRGQQEAVGVSVPGSGSYDLTPDVDSGRRVKHPTRPS